jgi:hypothetical protein
MTFEAEKVCRELTLEERAGVAPARGHDGKRREKRASSRRHRIMVAQRISWNACHLRSALPSVFLAK